METRAKYILIGAFTIAGFVGILGFLLWFARVELDRQFAYYDIRFSSVSGLGNASDVRFAGLPVGRVVDVQLSPDRDGTVLVRIEVASDTPVRTDSVATIEAQGVTGVSFVGIDPGTPDAPLLESTPQNPVPEIEAGQSVLQALSEDAPRLLAETLAVVENIGAVLGGDTPQRIERIFANVESASEDFSQALDDFSEISGTVSDFATEISRFNATLEAVTGDLTAVLQRADATLIAIADLSDEARAAVGKGADTLDGMQTAVAQAERFVAEDMTATATALRDAVAEIRAEVAGLGADGRALLATLDTAGTTATARLDEVAGTLAAADALIARLDAAAEAADGAIARVDGLIATDGTALVSETRAMVAEARQAIASVNAVADADLPAIVADIRAATATATRVIDTVGADLSQAGGRIDSIAASAETALAEAATTFGNANDTLAAIDAALETGDRALSAAERAFTGADRILNEDIADLADRLETTLGGLDAAVAGVAGDLPLIAADLREASAAAAAAFVDLRAVTGDAAGPVREFLTTALPLYSRLAQEARTLIANLDSLTQRIERDPARFFLDRTTPEFRR